VSTLPLNPSEWVRRLNPHIYGHEIAPDNSIPDAKSKRNNAPTLGGAKKREVKSLARVIVRFTGYRVRPLDPDNFAASCKGLLDGLRHAQIISGDEPWRIRLETEQVKVKHFKSERTEVEIIGIEL